MQGAKCLAQETEMASMHEANGCATGCCKGEGGKEGGWMC
jgi:hypothetical protein